MSKFIIDNKTLYTRLMELKKILPESEIKAIDKYVLFEVGPKSLTIVSNGSNMEIKTEIGIEGDGEVFSTSVPADLLVNTIKTFSNKELVFEYVTHVVDENTTSEVLMMTSGKKSAYKLNCEPADCYPRMKMSFPTSKLRVDASYIKKSFMMASLFTDMSDNGMLVRPGLQSISMEAQGEYIKVTAANSSNGYRAIFYAHDTVDKFDKVNIPSIFGSILENMMGTSETVAIQHDGHTLHAPTAMFDLKCSLSDMPFPQMDSIFAQRDDCMKAEIIREDMFNAMRRLKFYNDNNKDLNMDIRTDKIMMSAASMFGAEGSEEITATMPKETQIAMNLQGMITTLGKIQTEKIRFYYIMPRVAFFVVPDYGEDQELSYSEQFIIMPIMYMNKK